MAVIETWYNQDLQQPVKVHYLDGSLFSHNGNGNRIGVHVFNNGAPVTLSGTVSGYVVTADGSTVPCTGTRSGNSASILIPAAAYQPGAVFITVFITDGSTVTTIASVATNVMTARTENQVSPGTTVQDWTQTINAAMQNVETAAEDIGGIVAVPYANITYPVPLGKYTYYEGNLYRCISPIAASESFTAAHWTQVRLGDDVSDLKSAINGLNSAVFETVEEQLNTTDVNGYWANGSFTSSENALSRKASLNGVSTIKVTGYIAKYYDIYDFLDSNNNVISFERKLTSVSEETRTLSVPENAVYIVASTVNEEYAATIKFYKVYPKDKINEINSEIESIEDSIDDINDAINGLNSAVFETVEEQLNTTDVNGYWANGSFTSSENALSRKASLNGVSTIKVTGYIAKYYDIYDFLDSNNNVISFERKTTSVSEETRILSVPQNAVYIVSSTSNEEYAATIKFYKVYPKDNKINKINGEIESIEDSIDDINNALYDTVDEKIQMTDVNGFWANGEFTSTQGVQGKKASVSGVTSVKVTGYIAKYYDVYDFLDSNNNVISFERKTTSVSEETRILSVPQNAVYIVSSTSNEEYAATINIYKQVPKDRITILEENIEEVIGNVEKINVSIENNNIIVTQKYNGSDMEVRAKKSDGGNGTFNFVGYTGSYNKTATDDICPLHYNGTYKGGAHGDQSGIVISATGHGKTVSDIGSQYKGANDVIITIVKIVDANTLLCIGEPYSDILTTRTGSRFITTNPTTPLVHVSGSGGTNTETITTCISTNNQQILPSINNRTIKLVADGKTITENGKYECVEFHAMEEYGLIDAYKMYLALRQNVGNNSNISYCADTIEDEIIYMVDYCFTSEGGCYVTSSITAIRDNIKTLNYGIVQAQSAGGTTYIPFTNNFATPQSQSGDIYEYSTTWEDNDEPPYKFYQLGNGNGFALGYDITYGDAKKGIRAECDDAYYSPITSKKMYPYIVHGLDPVQYQTITALAYRVPVVYADNMIAFCYPSDGYKIVELEFMTAKNGKFALQEALNGKHIEIVKSSSTVHILSKIVIDNEIRYISTGAGSCTLKIN